MAVIDVPGFVADLKDHATRHGFHVHDERHFVETYSMRQAWEVDLHPEEACGGPLDLHLSLEVDPRIILAFEDLVIDAPRGRRARRRCTRSRCNFTWSLPPLPKCPDLLVLATELAGIGGADLPHRGLGHRLVRRRSPTRPSAASTIIARMDVSLDAGLPGDRGSLRRARAAASR